jgi:hypothetical protein
VSNKKIVIWASSKLKSCCIKRLKTKATNSEKALAIHISEKRLSSRIYKDSKSTIQETFQLEHVKTCKDCH